LYDRSEEVVGNYARSLKGVIEDKERPVLGVIMLNGK
jgi:hypothetical protein